MSPGSPITYFNYKFFSSSTEKGPLCIEEDLTRHAIVKSASAREIVEQYSGKNETAKAKKAIVMVVELL